MWCIRSGVKSKSKEDRMSTTNQTTTIYRRTRDNFSEIWVTKYDDWMQRSRMTALSIYLGFTENTPPLSHRQVTPPVELRGPHGKSLPSNWEPYGGVLTWGNTPSHPFRTMGYSINFHYKPSVWGYPGYPHSWKPHIINTITTSIQIALRFGFSEHLRSSQEGIFGTRRRSWFPSSAGSSSARGE